MSAESPLRSIHTFLLGPLLSLIGFSTVGQAQLYSVSPDSIPTLSIPVLSPPSFRSIGDAAKNSIDQLDPEKIRDIEETQEFFLSSVQALESHLRRASSDANAQAWMTYLEIDAVMKGIEDEESPIKLAAKVTRVAQHATGTHPGLEVTAVRRVRLAANRFSNALRFSRKDKIIQAIGKQLDKFADGWAEVDSIPQPEDLETLELLLDLFERTDQGDIALVRQSLSSFSHPNFQITVDDALVQRSINRNVVQCSPVRDCILGTRIVGDALLSGDVTATLLPSTGSIRLRIALQGTVRSTNTGYNGPVRLRTTGNGNVYASQILSFTENGLSLEPAVTTASLTTQINRIEHRLRLVRRIAKKKAAEQKPQADAIARGKLIDRVAEGFAKDINQAVSKPIPDVMKDVRPVLKRLNFREPTRTIGSTSDSVYLSATVRQGNQLAAPIPAPPAPGGYEATIQIHESVINNTLGSILAGRTMSQSELSDLVRKIGRNKPTENSDEQEDKEGFEIDFDRSRPILFEARDGKIRIGIRGTRFAQGKRELKKRLEIFAVYRPIKTMDGIVLLDREGDAEIDFPGTKKLSFSQAGLRGSIKKGFADAFPQILMDQPWSVPSTIEAPAVAGRTYRPRYFDARDGWLTLSVN